MENSSALAGAYLTKGTIGNVGMPGAPIAHFSLVVVPAANSVSGTVEVTQAISGPNSKIVAQVKGQIRATGFGKVTKIVSLEGEYVQSVPPPAIGSYLSKFSAHMAIDNSWNGQGGFSYGNTDIDDVPVKSDN
ncbi:DUF1842 domain-containing protein [Polaribacter sp. Hel1_85]|uniref:DUF1842 domain-containing protein n=1 Tax=Polaribacter sp. Hel1_85 TaxID=1250005 RepID=UPI00052CA5EB|nr:DUF1842 domain-containing protein [Polaribacter sp. Hel1_85]KGL62749.1 hypothetical protein PHEL85_2544 [Polaribacter sp. Hel1_85]